MLGRMGVHKGDEGLKIDSAAIGMESARSYHASKTTVSRFVITEYQANLAGMATTTDGNALGNAAGENTETDEKNSNEALAQEKPTLEEWQNRLEKSTARLKVRSESSTTFTNIQQHTIRYIFDLLFGSWKHRFNDWLKEQTESNSATSETDLIQPGQLQAQDSDSFLVGNLKVLNYVQESWRTEEENTSFSTVGTVCTGDGREIHFNVNVGMSRSFREYYRNNLEVASFQFCDPLVINLDTDVAEMSDQNFYFDIDGDGEKDQIAQLNGKSGYLALDKNNDGMINDGRELFGTESGNGFADLEKYDEDGNGWIDENDEIWSKLKIWCKDENGKDVLYRLADKGVGAICLQRADTDFTLKGMEGQTKGRIRNTGIFLYENGNVGTIQHVDVAKYRGQA